MQGDVARKTAEGGIETGQVDPRVEIIEIVDGFYAQTLIQASLEQCSDQGASDTPVSIEGDSQHGGLLPVVLSSA